MQSKGEGIRYVEGSSDILLVAPHSPVINGEYQNDIRTGVITEKMQQELGCSAIINDRYFKPKGTITKDAANFYLDLYRIDHARKVPGYLERIRETVDRKGKTLVVFVHGIADDVADNQGRLHRRQGLFSGNPEELHGLIGYGQGGDPKTGEQQDRFSARSETVAALAGELTRLGMTTIPTWREGDNFRGRDAKRLNQWFNQLEYGFDRIESIQLEIREKGFRDSEANALEAARIIGQALTSLVRAST